MLLSVVLHVVFKFYGGEYDPLYVERVKQTLFMLYDEKLMSIIKQNFDEISLSTPYHSAKLMNKIPPMHIRVPKKSSKKKMMAKMTGRAAHDELPNPESDDSGHKNIFDQPRVSLIRGSELLSHEIKHRAYDSHRPTHNQYEPSSRADQSLGLDEESKINMNMSMKAPLDSSNIFNKNRHKSSTRKEIPKAESKLKRSNSAVGRILKSNTTSGIEDVMKIDPISLPFSKGKLYHYLHINEGTGLNLSPPIKASPNWFSQVYKHIFRAY